MNIKGILVAVVMASSVAGVAGCSQAADIVDSATAEGAEQQTGNWYRSWWGGPAVARPVVGVRFAPPAARYEAIGRAPSARHFWVAGYHRWTGTRYAWVGGRWDVRRPGYNYVPGRWNHVGSSYRWTPGVWRHI